MIFDMTTIDFTMSPFFKYECYFYEDAAEMFNTTITCPGKKQVYIGNMFLVQYLQSYITMICPEQNTGKKTSGQLCLSLFVCTSLLHFQG